MITALTRHWLTGILAISCQLACAADLAPVQVSDNHGFIDINVPITAVVQEAGETRITARGSVEGSAVGFEVAFPTTRTQPQGLPHMLRVETARLLSLGGDSDNFVAFLARKYGIATASSRMLPFVDASAAGLGESKGAVTTGKKKIKFFFFDSGPENRYAELYINVDFDNRQLEFHEKDPYYRKPLLLALTQGP
jgi:hypothetical protein